MHHLTRAVALLAVGMLIAGLGCAGSQTKDDRKVAGQPPEEEPSDEMPSGPPVKTEKDLPERAKKESDESDTSDASDRADESDGSEESADGAEVITESQRKRLLDKGPPYIFQVVQLEPAKKDGEFRGYEIVGAKPEAQEAMSPQLEIGDIITRINGVAIERPKDYMKAWEKFADGEDVRIDLLRDGEKREADWVVRADDSQ